MPEPRPLNGRRRREPFPNKSMSKGTDRMTGDLIVMAVLIGIGRAFFVSRKHGPMQRSLSVLQETFTESGRGETTENPVKAWKDIAWRVYEGLQNDRVLLVSAGVTFYALLALFPATAALVSLYGLFADATTINEHL